MFANFRKMILAGLGLAAIWVMFSPNASAQRYDKGTTVTMNESRHLFRW
jgi:hypothetical protein